jgi:hypothetical protein
LKLLTKMGYEGKGLGNMGQGIINPIEVVERPRYLGLGYGEVEIGECSKTLEVSDASKDQNKSLREQFMKGDGVSLHDGDSDCKSSPKKSEDKQDTYNGHGFSKSLFDYKKNNHVIQNLWHMYPCTFCHSLKHCVEKCRKIQSLYKKFMSTKKETQHKDSNPQRKKETGKQVWMPKNHCTYCNRGGHRKANCWKLNTELRPKKDKNIVHVLTKEEALPAKQEEQYEGKKTITWFFQKWMSHLHCILLPLL